MSECPHGERVKRSGYGRHSGRSYTALFCPSALSDCDPEWLAPELPEHPGEAAYRLALESAKVKYKHAIIAARAERDREIAEALLEFKSLRITPGETVRKRATRRSDLQQRITGKIV